MVRGLYMAGTGMNVQATRLEVISNDLANVNTTAYKKDVAVIESFKDMLTKRIDGTQSQQYTPAWEPFSIGTLSYGVSVEEIYTDFTQGSFIGTNNDTDFAIQGDGFFLVDTPAGMMLTRDGNFDVNIYGELVTQEGYGVYGKDGYLIELGEDYLNNGLSMQVTHLGEIMLGGEVVNQIDLVTVEDMQTLLKRADNLYEPTTDLLDSDAIIQQGFVEGSNVNPVIAMVDMITVARAYEASQKMVQVHDELVSKAVNEVGKA